MKWSALLSAPFQLPTLKGWGLYFEELDEPESSRPKPQRGDRCIETAALAMPTAADVKGWLTQAQQLARTDPDYLRGIAVLEQLLVALTPKETVLLPNYPNPFNPETWIPYRLAKAADVTLTIYDLSGGVVRRLNVGHRLAAVYESRDKAIYWDGRTEFGERVASGIYFYYLTAGDYSATRKMVILK